MTNNTGADGNTTLTLNNITNFQRPKLSSLYWKKAFLQRAFLLTHKNLWPRVSVQMCCLLYSGGRVGSFGGRVLAGAIRLNGGADLLDRAPEKARHPPNPRSRPCLFE